MSFEAHQQEQRFPCPPPCRQSKELPFPPERLRVTTLALIRAARLPNHHCFAFAISGVLPARLFLSGHGQVSNALSAQEGRGAAPFGAGKKSAEGIDRRD